MTEYRVNCSRCTNKAIGENGATYCLPARELRKSVCYIEDGHAGTAEDPDIVCCDYYSTEPRQIVMIPVEW